MFSLSEVYGATCPAGAHRPLKVGMAGPRSKPRFTYQHYSPASAPSTLAGTLLQARVLWPFLGIEDLDERSSGAWLQEHTNRDHFLPPEDKADILRPLETYVRGRVTSIWENTLHRPPSLCASGKHVQVRDHGGSAGSRFGDLVI